MTDEIDRDRRCYLGDAAMTLAADVGLVSRRRCHTARIVACCQEISSGRINRNTDRPG